MRIALAILLVIGSGFNDLDKIAKANKLKKEAKEAYQNGDFTTAIANYQYLLDSMQIDDDNIRLNLANAYYQSNDTTNAESSYSSLATSDSRLVQSTAYQQTGIIQNNQKKYKEALQSFKNALKADPTNEGARYNYEMLKKLIKEQEEQQKNQKNKDQQNKDQNKDQEKQDEQNQDQKNKDQDKQEQKDKENSKEQNDQEKEDEKKGGEEGEEKEEQPKEGEEKEDEEKEGEKKDMPQQADNMKEMKISEEKAKMILEAMKNNEIQYLQQNKRKPTKRKDTGKPDW